MEDRKIPRQKTLVAVSLSDGRSLSGVIQIDLDTRLSDFMNQKDRFVVLRDLDDSLKLINKDHIIDIRIQ